MTKDKVPHATHHAQVNKLKRVEGQVRGLQKMIQSEKYCINILQQFKAVHAALNNIETEIMKRHVEKCMVSTVRRNAKQELARKIDEIMDVIKASRK